MEFSRRRNSPYRRHSSALLQRARSWSAAFKEMRRLFRKGSSCGSVYPGDLPGIYAYDGQCPLPVRSADGADPAVGESRNHLLHRFQRRVRNDPFNQP